MLNSLEDITKVDDRKTIVYKVKAWGNQEVRLRQMTVEHALRVVELANAVAEKNDHHLMAEYLATFAGYSLVDDKGELLVKKHEDFQVLKQKSSAALQEIVEACSDFNTAEEVDIQVKK